MDKKLKPENPQEIQGLFAAIFPREYDFEGMLAEQSDHTIRGIQQFIHWMQTNPRSDPWHLKELESEVDGLRHDMEEKLVNSFSTPFDRQDIYSISRQMDYILNFSKETATEMYAFGVLPDKTIHDMTERLLAGTECIGRGIRVMNDDKTAVENEIRQAREACNAMDECYITGMAELLRTTDAMNAMRTKEIYHHLRDAGRAMRDTLDILHNAVIDLP